jgi:hypothetical protein
MNQREPLAKMSGQRVEGEMEPITGENWETARSQELSQGMDEQMGHVLGAGTQMEHWKHFRASINRQPEPEHLATATEPRSQFIQRHMRELEGAETVFV